MKAKEQMKTWKWRILKAGYDYKSFSEYTGITAGLLSQYCSGHKTPTLKRFDYIEEKLSQIERPNHETE